MSRESTLTEQVYDQLRGAIIDGQLAPGTLHSVKQLSDLLQVSRTPVREALIDLASQDMVRFERNRGVRVLETSTSDLEDIYAIRLLLEVPATHLAVERMTPEALETLRDSLDRMQAAADAGDEPELMRWDREFHALILRQSGNERLAAQVDHLRDLILTRGMSTVGRSRESVDLVIAHRQILDAVERSDALGASDAMRRHIFETGWLIIKQERGHEETTLGAWAQVLERDGARGS